MVYGRVRRFMENLSAIRNAKIRRHRIRHTVGTELMRLTENPKTVQQILGHSSIVTTMMYVHPDMNDMRSLISRMP